MRSRRFRYDWLGLFLLACAIRLAVGLLTGRLVTPETFEYDGMARNVLAGRGLTFTHLGIVYHSFAPPLLAWISAGSYWLTGSIVPVMLLQIAAGAALVIVTAAIAERVFGDRLAGWAAGGLVAVHPGFVLYNAAKAHPLSFDALFFSLAALIFLRLDEQPTIRRGVALGLVVGAGTLSRSTMLIFLPLGAVWLLAVTPRRSWRAPIIALAAAAIVAFVVVLPWSIRDSLVHHRGLFLISTTGEDFWDGNNPYATGHSYIDAHHMVIDALPAAERADLERQPDEIAQSQWFMSHAVAFIRANPEAFLRLTAVKLFHFWWFAPQTGVLYPVAWREWYMTYYVVVLVLAAAGCWRLMRLGAPAIRRAALLAVFAIGLSALQSLYYVETRHRWAIESLLLAISGGGAALLLGRAKGRAPDGPSPRLDQPGVLMVTGAYVPEMSGAGLQCRALVRELRDEVRFAVLTTTVDRSLPADDERDGVPVYRVFVNPASGWSKLTAALRMTRVVLRERERFSILHLHGFSQKSMLLIGFALAAGKRVGIKLTSVGHDDPASMRARGGPAYWFYSRADAFFGVSPRFQALYAASDLPSGRFHLMPNGVDVDRFRPASRDERHALRAELGLPADRPVILFVGFFSSEKCPDVLFDAWSRVAADGDHSSVLVFVGATRSDYYEVDARLAADIRDRASRLDLDTRLYFVEATTEIDKYYRAADLFVLPSVREGMPNALLEAMACGAGCIATRLDGVTDVLLDEDCGILVPGRDAAALAIALAGLIADPAHARAQGARARQRIERHFALARTAPQYLAVYREMLAS